MNERKIHRVAEFLADDIESEAGPKVGPVQKAVPVTEGPNESIANELLLIAEDLVAMDFSTQKQMDDYLKKHPDADRSNHKVVKHDPGKPETHPHNLMKQRENEKAMGDIGKHFKKDPKDLTVDEITEYNQKKGK